MGCGPPGRLSSAAETGAERAECSQYRCRQTWMPSASDHARSGRSGPHGATTLHRLAFANGTSTMWLSITTCFAGCATRLDLWETEYIHLMPDVEAIGQWYKGSGLRPFLDVLPDDDCRDAIHGGLRFRSAGRLHASRGRAATVSVSASFSDRVQVRPGRPIEIGRPVEFVYPAKPQ